MTMHCPHCRLANAATTRFCTGCGAVLVESVRGVGRRRVLRPWGLRRAAPQTESPAMPGIAEALHAARRASRRPARKLGVVLASGIAVTAVAGTLVYPYAVHGREEPLAPPVVIVETAISLPAVTSLREAQFTAPPLIESSPAPPAVRSREARRAPAVRPVAESIAAPVPEAPVALPVVAVMTQAPPEPVAVPAPVDRMLSLRGTLTACGSREGLFDRAICEQQARLDHCAGYWDNAPLCPSGRYDHTR